MSDPIKILLQKMIERGFDPVEAMALVTEVLATRGKDQAAEKRRAWDREYRKRVRGVSTRIHPYPPDIHPTSTRHDGIYIDNTYVKTMDVEAKELPVKQVTLDQVPVSRARARKKSSSSFPEIWPTNEIVQIGASFGLSEDQVLSECDAMRDWAHSKDERRVNWIAFARNWLRSSKKKTSFVAKQPSPHLQNIQKNERTADEAFAAIIGGAITINKSNPFDRIATNGSPLGTAVGKALPQHGGDGFDNGVFGGSGGNPDGVPGKSGVSGLQPGSRDLLETGFFPDAKPTQGGLR